MASHGEILCGTVLAPDFSAALADYRERLGLEPVEQGVIAPDLARSWGAPAQVGCRFALLRAGRGFLRLVGGSAAPQGFRPLSSFGWAAFEMSVRDAFALHERLQGGPFRVLGAPKHVPGFANFIPFQVAGRSGEVLYLNTVLEERMAGLDLPRARDEVDGMFIAVLAAADRDATLRFHVEALGFEEGETFRFPYSMINLSFGLPDSHETVVTMTKTGRTPACEIDQYPPDAGERPRNPGELPPGNSLVTFAHRDLDAIAAPFIEPPARRDGPLYGGARVACVAGPSGERIELVECS